MSCESINNFALWCLTAGNDDDLFILEPFEPEPGQYAARVRLNPARAANGLDRETQTRYSMDVLAYNKVSDDSVIRQRRKRSTNPSIVTVNINVQDINDTPPRFTSARYLGCKYLFHSYLWGSCGLMLHRGPAKKTRCTRHLASKPEIIIGQFWYILINILTIKNYH